MKTKRELKIRNKVLTKRDIQNIWRIIDKELSESRKAGNHLSINLEINCDDCLSFESDTSDLLEDGDILDIKSCSSINIDYHDYKLERRISINLIQGNLDRSTLLVRGDKNWVSGTFDSLSYVIESAKSQHHWFIKYKKIIQHVSAIGFGFLIYNLSSILWFQHIEPLKNPSETLLVIRKFFNQNRFAQELLMISSYWLQGIFISTFTMPWVLSLWPNIEFDFGPEHAKTEKKRRQRLGVFFSFLFVSIIIPLITNWLSKFL